MFESNKNLLYVLYSYIPKIAEDKIRLKYKVTSLSKGYERKLGLS